MSFAHGLGLARLAGGRISVDEFHASLAGGTVEGAGTVTLTGEGTSGEVSLSWAELSADLLLAAVWPPRPVAIASSLTGTADAQGRIGITRWHQRPARPRADTRR